MKPETTLAEEKPTATATAAATTHHHRQTALERIVSNVDLTDATERYQLERDDNRPSSQHDTGRTVISWHHNDAENPYNWPAWKKVWIVFVGVISALNSTLGSSLPSNAISYIAEDFHVTNETQLVLPISVFVLGYVFGPMLYGPLSETYGRKAITVPTFTCFTIFTMACALAPTWAALIVFRFLCGMVGSAPIALVGGLYADIYSDPLARGRAIAMFMAATGVGPLFAPLISGYISPERGWRWTFWVGLIFAGASWFAVVTVPETYGPVLLARRAKRLRRERKDPNIFAPLELERKGFRQMATVTLTRPVRMLFFELIVAATCAYLALAYAIFYMFFEAYPIIFEDIYGFSTGVAGLMFLPNVFGEILAVGVALLWDTYLSRAKARNAPWTQREEARRLPLACLAGPLWVISLFWMGWTARPGVHWVVPFLAGIPYGMGFVLIFIAMLNYITDAYQIFAASALAATSCARSIAGSVLPFAARPMYKTLGVAWASSLLGFASLVMCFIPFIFFWYGEAIRERSKFCVYLKEMKEQQDSTADEEKAAADVRDQADGTDERRDFRSA
ncbi:MAG: hypothetical protein M1818_005632 [Claussenomyces sp. TS43310]|nr:MAG: hypothetical protein M1818_005632 [Claussenomyces sp. TS43310]